MENITQYLNKAILGLKAFLLLLLTIMILSFIVDVKQQCGNFHDYISWVFESNDRVKFSFNSCITSKMEDQRERSEAQREKMKVEQEKRQKEMAEQAKLNPPATTPATATPQVQPVKTK